jgi:4-amino-4-deoxy-L-arabinose transferase-like glycosyltransferase
MLAAAACAWGAAGFFGAPTGLLAGAMLGTTFLLSTEALIAKTDAVLCGTTTLALAALARLYAEARAEDGQGPPAGKRAWLLFWIGLSVGTLDKGPVAPMVAALTIAALCLMDRKAAWLGRLNWVWGLIILVAICGPWAWAVTVATDGGFWSAALGGDLAPKLAGGQETHGAPPGYHTLLAPILMFPMTLMLPAAAVTAWRRWREPGVRFAIAWLVPTWLMFEIMPTKLPHYTLPTYGALAWLAAVALTRPVGRLSGWIGGGLSLVVGVAVAVVAAVAQARFGSPASLEWSAVTGVLAVAAGLAGAAMVLTPRRLLALAAALTLGAGAHAALAAGEAPRLGSLWLSRRLVLALDHVRLNPRGGLIPGPVTVVGYAEPSLVFGLGTETEFGDVGDAADAIAEGRPAVIEQRQDAAFQKELAEDGLSATAIGTVSGLDYSVNRNDMLTIYQSDNPPTPSKAKQGSAP